MANDEPISVNPKPYRGRDARKIAAYHAECEAATALQNYLNAQHKPGQLQSLLYSDIARKTGLDQKMVKRLLFRVRGGDNGITI